MDFACLDFINSEQWDGFGQRTDHLENPVWVKQFLAKWDLAGGLEPEQLDMAQLVKLRALLRRMVEDIAKGGQAAKEDMAEFNALLKGTPVYRQLVRHNENYEVKLVPLTFSEQSILVEIAVSLAELLTQHNWRRVKVCHNDGCRWAFYDQTRGNTRRWCSDLTCGNRDKVRRFRARHKKTQSNS